MVFLCFPVFIDLGYISRCQGPVDDEIGLQTFNPNIVVTLPTVTGKYS